MVTIHSIDPCTYPGPRLPNNSKTLFNNICSLCSSFKPLLWFALCSNLLQNFHNQQFTDKIFIHKHKDISHRIGFECVQCTIIYFKWKSFAGITFNESKSKVQMSSTNANHIHRKLQPTICLVRLCKQQMSQTKINFVQHKNTFWYLLTVII